MTISELKVAIHRQIERYDSAHDNNQRRMASRNLLAILKENHLVIQEVLPEFQKFYQELHFCCFHKSDIYKFMSNTIHPLVSNNMLKLISEQLEQKISEEIVEAITESVIESLAHFWPKVIAKLLHHFWEQFDEATK